MKKIVLIAILAITATTMAMAWVGMELYDNNSKLYFRVTSLNPNRVEVIRNHGVYYTGNIDIPSYVTQNRAIYIVTAIESRAFSECSSVTSVNIPNSVTEIGSYAFYMCSSLKSVDIPNSVTTIGSYAFYRSGIADINVGSSNPRFASDDGILFSKNMDTIICYPQGKTNSTYTIPGSVTTIGDSAFDECRSLTSVNIGNSVKTIEIGAFGMCSSLTSIDIPNSVTLMGNVAFFGCSSLTTVNIGNSITSIGELTFYGCDSLTTVNIGNSVNSIGEKAFQGCGKLTYIDIPNSVNSIGNEAFGMCSSLTSINIPNSVNSIGYGVFYGCSKLTTVNIGNSVNSIGSSAFSGCSSLRKIKIDVANPAFITLDYGIFDGVRKGNYPDACILLVPAGSVPAYSNAPQWSEFMPNIFEAQNVVITYNQLAGGTLAILDAAQGSSIPSGSQIELGTVINIKATPDYGYHLSKIEVNGEVITGTEITVKRDTYIYVEFAPGTGIDHSHYTALSIYPTPASESVTVATEVGSQPLSVTVTDLSGRTVATAIATGSKTEINISHLPQGTYIVRVGDKVGRMVKK